MKRPRLASLKIGQIGKTEISIYPAPDVKCLQTAKKRTKKQPHPIRSMCVTATEGDEEEAAPRELCWIQC